MTTSTGGEEKKKKKKSGNASQGPPTEATPPLSSNDSSNSSSSSDGIVATVAGLSQQWHKEATIASITVRSLLRPINQMKPNYNKLSIMITNVLKKRPPTVTMTQPCVARLLIFLAECLGNPLPAVACFPSFVLCHCYCCCWCNGRRCS
jgi:hypothetical protein